MIIYKFLFFKYSLRCHERLFLATQRYVGILLELIEIIPQGYFWKIRKNYVGSQKYVCTKTLHLILHLFIYNFLINHNVCTYILCTLWSVEMILSTSGCNGIFLAVATVARKILLNFQGKKPWMRQLECIHRDKIFSVFTSFIKICKNLVLAWTFSVCANLDTS